MLWFSPLMAINLDKYHTEVLRKLEGFKFAKEWSDFVGLLDSLCQIFRKYKADYVPWIPQLVKRLNQLLNPALPGGVHLKTIECYRVIFGCISKENFLKDFDVLTIGIFGFAQHCRIIVATEYLDLLEMIITHLGSKVEPFSHHIILGFLPFLESESSEFFNRAYDTLVVFLTEISEAGFYKSLWRNFIDYPELRICILNFLTRYKVVVIPEYNLVNNALCVGMESENSYITRYLLEISNRDFPLTIDQRQSPERTPQNNAFGQVGPGQNRDLDRGIMGNDAMQLRGLSLDGRYVNDGPTSSSTLETPSEVSSVQNDPKPHQIVKDLANDNLNTLNAEAREEAIAEMRECNTQLIKHVLRIFLKKEVGINKRAYKWLNLGESVSEHDVNYIERGLRAYLRGSDDDLFMFFRIINSLGYRDNLIVFLMERFALDSIRMLKTIEFSGRLDVMMGLKKHARIFLSLSLDELYRVFYTSLQRAFGSCADLEDEDDDLSSEINNISSSSDLATVKSFALSYSSKNEAEELLRLVLYSIETLDAVDSNVENIHIPLLCHLVVRNRSRISGQLFFYFMNILLERSEKSEGSAASEISSALISSFYLKENSKELLEVSLIGSLARLLSRAETYKESTEDPIYWSSSDLVLQDGILVWTENKDILRARRKTKGFFNFHSKDVELIHRFIRKYGFKDFSEEFLVRVGKYLCFNYKFVEMVETLKFYVDLTFLNVTLWNDFIVSKNPKFLMFYGEDQLLPFLSDILPTVSLRDICIFLRQAMVTGSFLDILFKVASVADTESNYFIDTLVNIRCVTSLMKYLLNRFYEYQSAEQTLSAERFPKFDIIKALLVIVEILVENKNLADILGENRPIEVEKFGEIGVLEALTGMVNTIIVSKFNEFSFEESYLGESDEEYNSVILDYTNGQGAEDSVRENVACSDDDSIAFADPGGVMKNTVVPYKKDRLSIKNSLRLANRSSAVVQIFQVHRIAFNILYKLHQRHIPVVLPDMGPIKSIIRKYREDYYILKRTIFLAGTDVEFVFENYMHFYKPILSDINGMEIGDKFFAYLTKVGTRCSIEIMLEAFQYFSESKSLKTEELFNKAMSMMVEECKKSCAVYKNVRGHYHRISENSLKLNHPLPAEETLVHDKRKVEHIYKTRIEPDQMCLIAGEDVSTQSLILVYMSDMSSVVRLSELLYKKSPAMFINSFPGTLESLFLFGSLPFKAEVFKRLLSISKPMKYPLKFLKVFAQTLSTETKKEIIRGEADYLRSSFGFSTPDISGMLFSLELFKNQSSSDLSRIVFANIMHCLEARIDSVVRVGANFDDEIKILSKLSRVSLRDQNTLNAFRFCLFELLNSKRYQERALEIIFAYMRANSNCKVFIDAYIQCFNRNFFDFGLDLKRRIFGEISASTNFDSFVVMENILSGMDSSFFMSAQSEEMLKISNLKKMSFLILTQPSSKFSTMSDSLVSLVNSLIGTGSEIKVETLKLCTAMILKIDHHYIQTLYPILVGDFMNTVLSKDLKVVREMFRFIDVSVWMNSPVFNFKVLFVEDHHFNKQLKLQIFHEVYTSPKIDYRLNKLPNLLVMIADRITNWSQLAMYLNMAGSYYGYIAEHLVERDFERVESNLIESYLEQK